MVTIKDIFKVEIWPTYCDHNTSHNNICSNFFGQFYRIFITLAEKWHCILHFSIGTTNCLSPPPQNIYLPTSQKNYAPADLYKSRCKPHALKQSGVITQSTIKIIHHSSFSECVITFPCSLWMPSKKKNYVDRETVPKVGRGGSTIPL